MTYEVLNKVSKKALISWLKNNILLPDISDERFLRDVKFQYLMDENKRLLDKNRELHEKIAALPNDAHSHFELAKLMVESSKINDEIEENSRQLDKLLKENT